MEIDESRVDGVVILRLTGQLANGPQVAPLQDRVKGLCSEGAVNVVIDLSDIQWFASAMLGVMSSSLVIAKKAGGGMRLAWLRPKVTAILKVTRLLPVFNPAESVQEAVASFQE